jgi:hypothetical protein
LFGVTIKFAAVIEASILFWFFNIVNNTKLFPEKPVLPLDVSTLQRPLLLLEVFTPQGPELHLDVSTLQRPVLHLDMSKPQGLELHLDLATLQRPVLHLDVSTSHGPELHLDLGGQQSMCCSWTCLHYRGERCTWMYLDYSSLCGFLTGLTAEAYAVPQSHS